MAPFLMAFAPASPGKPHPAPWKPANGGLAIDINAELFLPAACKLEHLDRLNTIWWIVALLRLKVASSLFVPIISSERFSAIPMIEQQPELWPMEIYSHLRTPQHENIRIDVVELEWLKLHWQPASILFGNEDFAIAFLAVDSSRSAPDPSLALVAVWGALERLFSASKQELTFRVSANIASYLEPPGRERYRCFRQIKALYDHRSRAAHGDHNKETTPYKETLAIARRALLKIVESRHVPRKDELEAQLFGDEMRVGDEGSSVH